LQNFQNLRKKGIALFVVMVTSTVLALMMVAFFQAYRSHFALTRASDSSQRAGAACDSVYQYVVYRVEHDRSWGSEQFNQSGLGDPKGSDLDVIETVGTHKFTGRVGSLDSTFEGEIYNNLSGTESTEVAAIADPGTIVCRVSAQSGSSTRKADFVVRVAPLFDSSVLSRANLDVDAEKLLMRSRDKNRNLLRAEGDIYVPNVLTGSDSQFLQPDSDDADDKGMLWSKGEIFSYLGAGGSAENIDEADELQAAVTNSNGKIVAGAESDFSIYDLDSSNLQLPETNREVPIQLGGVDKPGRWNFIRRKADVDFTATYLDAGTGLEATKSYSEEAWIDVLEYYPEGSEEPTEVYRAANRTDDLEDFADDSVEARVKSGKKKKKKNKTVTLDLDAITTDKVEMPDYPGLDVTLLDNDQLVFESADKEANLTFDLMTQSVLASPNATVTVKGDPNSNIKGNFEVTSDTDPKALIEGIGPTPPPILDLGYESDGKTKAVLMADGTLNIENGVTTGLGALVAKDGDVKIQPMNTDTVTVDAGAEGTGLLVFAGGNVVLSNPNETESWLFKGLVYAREGIRMEGHGQDATFEGTIVALQENDPTPAAPPEKASPNGIEFDDCGQIEFIYNSELLDAYVKNLPGQRIQLELVYWKR
jgi:hypothetical protein